MLGRCSIGLVPALPVAGPATAQNFQRGLAAYERDDYQTTLKEFAPLAERGSAMAQQT